MKILLLLILFSVSSFAQSFNEEMDTAYKNAVKGIYYAFENIPENKSKINSKLIDNNQLLADVKLDKEVEGVVAESTGFYKTYSVTIKVYKSFSTLKEEGFLKNYN